MCEALAGRARQRLCEGCVDQELRADRRVLVQCEASADQGGVLLGAAAYPAGLGQADRARLAQHAHVVADGALAHLQHLGELAAKAQEAQGEELFATAVLIEYDSLAHRVAVTDHGHVEPVLISCGEVRVLSGLPALPLGLGGLAETGTAAVWRHRFARGDILLLVTGGLVVARDTDGDFYPLVNRLRHRFADRPAPGPADVINFLDTDLPRHTRLHDDVAMMGGGGHRNGGRRIPGGEQWSRSHSTVRSA